MSSGLPKFYFEDIELGEVYTSPGRTITEADIVNFAAFSGDWNELHTNEEYSKASMFGRRVAHGPLGIAIQPSMTHRTRFGFVHIMAMLGINWRFLKPIMMGDTVHAVTTVIEKREVSKPDRGIVLLKRLLLNQNDVVVQEGELTFMLARRPGGK